MELKKLAKNLDTRSAREVINNDHTDENLKTLLRLAINRDGPRIRPCHDLAWEECMTKEGSDLWLWYNDPTDNSKIVAITLETGAPVEESIIEAKLKQMDVLL
jgi:(2Fe-2S) ferredoxin